MRRLLLVPIALAATALLPATASAAFQYGTAAGEITSASAKLWAHSTRSGVGVLQVDFDRGFLPPVASRVVRARSSSDNNLQATVRGLRPGRRYFYRFVMGRSRSTVGTFKTAPLPTQSRTIRFAWSGDADAQRAKGQRRPFYNLFQVYARMLGERNDFNINLGDTIYTDSEIGTVPFGRPVPQPYQGFAPALTRRAKWAKYKQNLALANLARFRTGGGTYSHPDDHEFINDFGPNETMSGRDANGNEITIPPGSVYRPGVQAFSDYAPVTYSSANGFYRSFRWGRNLELFFLDERSFRSAKAGSRTIHTCDNPQTGSPDLAPTGPQSTRSFFAAAVPSLSQPVSQQCLNTINDPSRTMLGSRQFARFTAAVRRSTARFKVIINEVPILELYTEPYDRWEGYAAERTRLLEFLKANVRNVVFLTTDVHANLVNEIQTNTLQANGTPTTHYGIFDVTTGPVATRTYRKEINQATDQDPETGSNGRLIDSLFFTPQPPNGLGMDPSVNRNTCSNIDTYSYGEVTVTSTQLRIVLNDINGRSVREEEGNRPTCGPYVINRQ